jgi:hypothetical protein
MGPHSFLWAIAFFVALIVGGGCLLLIAAATCGWFACRGSPGPAISRPAMNQVGVPPSRPER